ncbi:MAG: TetR/AcrR family transcriptional regulator [Gulosibacter sp.]|uniref:TetR/AcrR family transcriptional regulator n=1 Tax=Gulosibacter sp. TaxID=2817531 RepID=UPI003F91943E
MADFEDPINEAIPRDVALAWGVAASPQRGPKREMSVERIVDAAIELADAEGLGAVSMAAVAAKLGFTPMSLYRYVTAKDDLILLMQETATGIPPESTREQDGWRDTLRALSDAQVRTYIAHPWIVDVPITGSTVTPNSASWLDACLAALEHTPLNDEERVAVALAITGHSRWVGIVLAGYAYQSRTTGRSDEEITRIEAGYFDELISSEEFPSLRRAIDAGVFLAEGDPFSFTLERILDGVADYIANLDSGAERLTQPTYPEPELPEVTSDKRYRDAKKSVRDLEKDLRDARKRERQALHEARERAKKTAEKKG